jgi:hypothetical protein
MTDEATMVSRRWRRDDAHGRACWSAELGRELVAAYRRGTMDAARCLGTYRLHGERSVLPPEAVVYLATRVVSGRTWPGGRPSWERYDGRSTSELLLDQGERELAALAGRGDAVFEGLVESGRLYFFPGPLALG